MLSPLALQSELDTLISSSTCIHTALFSHPEAGLLLAASSSWQQEPTETIVATSSSSNVVEGRLKGLMHLVDPARGKRTSFASRDERNRSLAALATQTWKDLAKKEGPTARSKVVNLKSFGPVLLRPILPPPTPHPTPYSSDIQDPNASSHHRDGDNSHRDATEMIMLLVVNYKKI